MIELLHGDCLSGMKELTEASVTAIVTDPPYGIGFMGKGWDKTIPRAEIWQEAFRVLRPGGTAFVFGSPRTFHRVACQLEDAGFKIHDCLLWLYGQGFPKGRNVKLPGWEGYSSKLKPGWEPILMARKPNDTSYTQNAEDFGVAALNIEAARVGTRWPANVVHDGSDEVLEHFPDALGQLARGKVGDGRKTRNAYGAFRRGGSTAVPRKDPTTSASRFFYCSKASKKDRAPYNDHPAVKPINLVRWLVRLVTMPEKTIVLDPFMGSGTTAVACAIEGASFVGMELDEHYVDIAQRRVEDV